MQTTVGEDERMIDLLVRGRHFRARPGDCGRSAAIEWRDRQGLPRDLGTRVVTVSRAAHYFDPDNATWPDIVVLRLEALAGAPPS